MPTMPSWDEQSALHLQSIAAAQGVDDLTIAHQNGLNFVMGDRRDFGGVLGTERYVAAMRNPATNTKVAYVYAMVFYTNTTQWFRYALNPTLDSPEAGGAPQSLNFANMGTATVETMTDTIVPANATFWAPETRVTSNAPVLLQFPRPAVIPPGVTFAVVGDASAAQETCANVYFYEKAAG